MKLPRRVKLHDHGIDVRAHKRALRKAGYFHGPGNRGRYGPKMQHAVRHFQQAHGLAGTGRIGDNTFNELQPHYDAFGRSLLAMYRVRRKRIMQAERESRVRRAMHQSMTWGLQNEPQVHYPPGDVRPQPNNVPIDRWVAHQLPIILDCSQAATAVAKEGGAPDPTASSWGKSTRPLFTGTMLTTCKQIDERALQVGDYVVFGPSTGDHVSVVYEEGDDPMMWSHGFDGGPILIRLSAQRGQHRAPIRCLSATDMR